jgi:hypothetical protein
MSLFTQMEGETPDVKAQLSEFYPTEVHEDGGYTGGVLAMDVTYERHRAAGKHGVFTLNFENYSGMRPMGIKVHTLQGEWLDIPVDGVSIAIDGTMELQDFVNACKMVVTTEELYDKLTK